VHFLGTVFCVYISRIAVIFCSMRCVAIFVCAESTDVHWRRGPPTFWFLWAAPISGPPTFLGDVNFFFLYIAIMTGENLQ